MADFSTIYVDLALTTPTRESSYIDSNGAVICDAVTQYGTMTNQLSFSEFQKYLQFRCADRSVTFKIKNTITITSTNLLISAYQLLRFPNKSTIYMHNQVENQSYKFIVNVSVGTGNSLHLNLSNANVYIMGMDLEYLHKGYLSFTAATSQIDTNYNKLHIYNSRFWLKEPDYLNYSKYDMSSGWTSVVIDDASVVFNNISRISCAGCIINNKDEGTTLASIIVIEPNSGYDNYNKSFMYEFSVSIFVRIYDFYKIYGKYTLSNPSTDILKFNVFTEIEGGFKNNVGVISHIGNFFLGATELHNKFQQLPTIPAICDDFLATATNDDFDYIHDDDWNSIDYSYVEDLSEDDLDYVSLYIDANVNLLSYGQRDGVGALWFNPMYSPLISVIPYVAHYGETVTLKNAESDYDATFDPSLYTWNINGNKVDVVTALGEYEYTIDAYGIIPIGMEIKSHNAFYSVNTDTTFKSNINSSDVDIRIGIFNKDGQGVNTFTTSDTVNFTVTNLTNVSPSSIKSTEVVITDIGSQFISIPNYENIWIGFNQFEFIGNKQILCEVVTIDGRSYYFSKYFSITETIGKTYYVDLSVEYDNQNDLKLKHGIFDDFEDQSIDNGFSTDFQSYYSIVKMYDEYVAKGVSNSEIIKGISDGDVIIEWSFVRTKETDKPRFIINTGTNNDNIEIYWDFIGDKINVLYNGVKSSKIYGNYNKDLNCDTLRKLYMRCEYSNNSLIIKYSLDNGQTYIEYDKSIQMKSFSNMTIRTQCDTGSGLGYIGIHADNVIDGLFTGYGQGSEQYPFTYQQMYDRIKVNGTGNKYDVYMCRNSRALPGRLRGQGVKFEIDRNKQYAIDVWNAQKYGPWMLSFHGFINPIELAGTTLSNGIIYNVPASGGDGLSNLSVTNLYDMLITWNSIQEKLKIIFYRLPNQYSNGDYQSNIFGCTIKSEQGFITTNGEVDPS